MKINNFLPEMDPRLSSFPTRQELSVIDPDIARLINAEEHRQCTELNLIASENYTHPAVRQATASVLTHKYAEGYPQKRYYGGCRVVDQVEELAIERAKVLFKAEHANVQPHAGSQANMAVYYGLLKPGDTILGMNLSQGGHLTHGHPVNFSGTLFKAVSYNVLATTHEIDYEQVQQLALEHKPKLIIAGASAYSRLIDFERFSRIAKEVGAYFMADIAHIAGLVAAQLHPNPFPWADVVTSTTHKTLRGPRGGLILCKKELAEAIDRAIIPGTQGGPFMHSIAAKAVAFELALQPSFKEYQKQIIKNAQAMVQEFKSLQYTIVADGTDNHLFIIDLRSKNITGLAAEVALEKIGITVSRSCIPFDPEKPRITSGIRIGTPAITTRGMKEHHAREMVHFIDMALHSAADDAQLASLKRSVEKFCAQFPLFA